MSETLWQKAYDEYVQDNSYQGKLKKENDRLKAKLQKIKQIVSDWNNDASHSFSDMCKINVILKE